MTSKTQSDSDHQTTTSPWLLVLAAVWILSFLGVFLNQQLPNNSTSEAPISRLDILTAIRSAPSTVLNPFDYSWTNPDAKWSNVRQRLPYWGIALLIWLSAWGWGRMTRRLLLRHASLFRSECFVIDFGFGLSLLSLWVLFLSSCGWMNSTFMLLPGFVLTGVALFQRRSIAAFQPPVGSSEVTSKPGRWSRTVNTVLVVWIAVFGLHLWLGTFTPAWDFDVREYHLQGPKEWWQAGQISFLQHNVYTSFPFLSEMLSLLAMIVEADPWRGAISGKATLGAFPFLSVVSVYAISRRIMNRTAGLLAALLLISTPWLLRISIIAYAESAITFYLIATTMLALRLTETDRIQHNSKMFAAIGFMAGSAMAAKYPGIISVVIPVGIFLVWMAIRRPKNCESTTQIQSRTKVLIISGYAIAVILAVGPWLLRNTVDTGNPVYPLVWSVFGGTDWDDSLNQKWKAGHSAPDHDLSAIPRHLADVAIRSDWQNGLLFALAIPAGIILFRRREICWLVVLSVWLLSTWWMFTHRIDRFWVPMIPVLAVIASASLHIHPSRIWRVFVLSVIALGSLYNQAFCRFDVIGFHAGLTDLQAASDMVIRDDIKYLNAALPDDSTVLMVGEADVFDCRFSTIYNTVFDKSIFQQWTCASDDVLAGTSKSANLPMKTPAKIHATLAAHQVTHVYVNWLEILRYRQTYGYTPYVTPARFRTLVEEGVLLPGRSTSTGILSDLSESQKSEVRSWPEFEHLEVPNGGWTGRVIYRVNTEFLLSSR